MELRGILIALLTAMSLSKLNFRFERNLKVLAVLVVVAIEVALGCYFWEQAKPGAVLGFLVKNGQKYTLVWKDEVTGYESRDYTSIQDATRYAREELRLKTGANPIAEHELEHLWMQDRFGTYLVFWKTVGVNYLNQISFHRRDDAVYFANSFRQGSYSPSPYGHSVLFMPDRAPMKTEPSSNLLIAALGFLWR